MTFKHKLSVRLALLRDALLLLSLAALLACEAAVTGITLTRVAISPPHITLQTGQAPSRFTAVGLTGRGDTANIAVTWKATGGTIAGVTSNGRQHFAEYQPSTLPGTYLVIAARGTGGAADTSTVTVIRPPVASVALSPAVAVLLVGTSLQLTATPQDSNRVPLAQRVVTWSSSAPAVASVSTSGQVSGLTAGSATVTATSEGKSATAAITVTNVPVAAVTVSPASASISAGATRQLSAVATDSAGNTLPSRVVTWSSSNAAVATVSGSGLVTGQAAGSATITGTSESRSGTAAITVVNVAVASVTVSPASASIQIGATQLLSAVTKDAAGNTLAGRVVTWSTSNSSVATVSSTGLVTGQAAGSATITATSEGKSGTSAITIPAPPPPGTRAGYYVAPNGSSSGNGSSSSPWSLSYAFAGAGGRIQPGDTVWLRGGTYALSQSTSTLSYLTGTSDQPIIVRQYPGERAILDGHLEIFGSDTWYWGFEVRGPGSNTIPHDVLGINIRAPRTKFINLIVHEHSGSAIGFWLEATGGPEIYGCIVYNNGYSDVDRGHGHNIYTMNTPGTGQKRIRDNVLFNAYAYNLQMYGTTVDNFLVEGNTMFNGGELESRWGSVVVWESGGSADDIEFRDNSFYETPGNMSNVVGSQFGEITMAANANGDAVLAGNYMVGRLVVGDWATAQVTNNTFYDYTLAMERASASKAGHTYSGNTYYGDAGSLLWEYNSTQYTFAGWKTATGMLNPGSYVDSSPTGTRVVVRPNVYEAGRGLITVYNWDLLSSVAVDVSGVLNVGDRYEVLNVQDLFGSPTTSGTYTGGSISIRMEATPPPMPIGGFAVRTPATTGPVFNVFVLVRVQ